MLNPFSWLFPGNIVDSAHSLFLSLPQPTQSNPFIDTNQLLSYVRKPSFTYMLSFSPLLYADPQLNNKLNIRFVHGDELINPLRGRRARTSIVSSVKTVLFLYLCFKKQQGYSGRQMP